MTKQEAIEQLRTLPVNKGNHYKWEAINMAIQALTDPEWIPNTGTKPECEYAHVRYVNGTTTFRRVDYAFWDVDDMDWEAAITHYIPIPAPPEFKEKRRFVVERVGSTWAVYDILDRVCVACHIETEPQAQSIADIYEQMNEETK